MSRPLSFSELCHDYFVKIIDEKNEKCDRDIVPKLLEEINIRVMENNSSFEQCLDKALVINLITKEEHKSILLSLRMTNISLTSLDKLKIRNGELYQKAILLGKILEKIAFQLKAYGKDQYEKNSMQYTDRLENAVQKYVFELEVKKDRTSANAALQEIKELMNYISSFVTKGEIDVIDKTLMDQYWDLCTIFQETAYKDQRF